MFTVKPSKGFDFIVKYQPYFSHFQKSVIIQADSKNDAYYQFLDFGFSFLKLQIEGLNKIIEKIKPYFFDSDSNPYLGDYHQWFFYYRTAIHLMNELEEEENQPLRYIETLYYNINRFGYLNPLDKRVFKLEFENLMQSIRQTTTLLYSKIEKRKEIAKAS